jgi:hypothetical protein
MPRLKICGLSVSSFVVEHLTKKDGSCFKASACGNQKYLGLNFYGGSWFPCELTKKVHLLHLQSNVILLCTDYPMDNCNKTFKVSMIPFLILIKI